MKDKCWIYEGKTNGWGYCQKKIGGKSYSVHRLSYELFHGKIPRHLTVDHICRVRNCINPNHLRLLPIRENILIGTSPSAKNAKKTHCPKGHPYDKDNTVIEYPYGNPKRVCRTCRNEHSKKHYRNNIPYYKKRNKNYWRRKKLAVTSSVDVMNKPF